MDATGERFAYRCLPLLLANEAGWSILSRHAFLATWDGGDGQESVVVEPLRGEGSCPAASHFGHGILTIQLPWLFRTSPGYNLLMRGPANLPKDGAAPLEGLIETDWTPATATMNWKLTRPRLTVRFDVGDTLCVIVPQRRGELESFHTVVEDVRDRPDVAGSHAAWSNSRAAFLEELRQPGARDQGITWQRHYVLGTAPDGTTSDTHQRRLRLRPFTSRPEEDA